jgi:hypothetical protein
MNIYFDRCESNEKKCREILKLPKHIQLALHDQILHHSKFNTEMNYLNIVKKVNKLHSTLCYKELKKGTYSLYIKSYTKFGFTYDFTTKKLNIWKNSLNKKNSNEFLLDMFVFLSQNREKYKIYEFDNGLFDIDFDIEILEKTFNSKLAIYLNPIRLKLPENIFHLPPSIFKNIVFGKIKTKNDLLEYILRYSYKFKKSFLTSDILEKISDLKLTHNNYQNIRSCFDDTKTFNHFITLLYNKYILGNHIMGYKKYNFKDCAINIIKDFNEILLYASYVNYKFNINDINNLFDNKSDYNQKFLKNLKEKDRLNRQMYNLLYLPNNSRMYGFTRSEDIYNDLPF